MGALMDAEGRATAETLVRNGRPTRLFRLARLDERAMGALLMHFMLETIFAAHLLGVDPFDQPAVEEGKVLTREYLAGARGSRCSDASAACRNRSSTASPPARWSSGRPRR